MDRKLMDLALPLVIANLREKLMDYDSPLTVVAGAARGADTLAADWARENHIAVEEHPAKWDELGKAAGAVRNLEMLGTGVDGVIAFPGGRGTAHMVLISEAAGVPVVNVHVGGFLDDESDPENE
jgi:hypothetical protein